MIVQPITPEALRKLADAATEGPWYTFETKLGLRNGIGSKAFPEDEAIMEDEWSGEADAEFIAAAREAIPALLDALKQAEADRDWLFRSSRLSKMERIKANARAERAEAQVSEEKRLRMKATAAVTEAEAERDAARRQYDEDTAYWIAATDTAEARIKAVERLAYAADDGTEYEHNGHDPAEGEAECPGCWALGIRRALDGNA